MKGEIKGNSSVGLKSAANRDMRSKKRNKR